jgi:hypothetical protein
LQVCDNLGLGWRVVSWQTSQEKWANFLGELV